jgi:hypothetical protein
MLFGLFGSGKKKTKYEEYIGDTGPRNWSCVGGVMNTHQVAGVVFLGPKKKKMI